MAQAVFRQKGPYSYPWKSGLYSTLKDFANKGETIKLDSQIRQIRACPWRIDIVASFERNVTMLHW
jgi:hypothetical protein